MESILRQATKWRTDKMNVLAVITRSSLPALREDPSEPLKIATSLPPLKREGRKTPIRCSCHIPGISCSKIVPQ